MFGPDEVLDGKPIDFKVFQKSLGLRFKFPHRYEVLIFEV